MAANHKFINHHFVSNIEKHTLDYRILSVLETFLSIYKKFLKLWH